MTNTAAPTARHISPAMTADLATMRAKMTERRARRGANPAESVALLSELVERHRGDNLAYALVYEGFATEAQAERFAHAHDLARADERVRLVAAQLPAFVALEADMGGTFALQLHLGSRGEADDTAGIDPDDPAATWWFDANGGELSTISPLGLDASPALVAEWITAQATAAGTPGFHA